MSDPAKTIRQLMGLAPSPPGRMPAMLAARRRIIDQPMLPSVLEPGKLVPDMLVPRSASTRALVDAYNLEGPLSDPAVLAALKKRVVLEDLAEGGASGVMRGEWGGSFARRPGTEFLGVMTYPKDVQNVGMARNIRRHEAMHGYNEAARQGMEGLPLLSRVTGAAPPALSIPMDELLAQQAGGAAFMDIPWGVYAQQYAQAGQSGAARTARALEAAQKARRLGGKAADFATDHPALIGAGLGTAYLLNRALAEEEPEEDYYDAMAGQ